jgi:hypothetical protein
MVVVDVCRHTGVRRIMEVRELGPVADGVLRQREIFSYRYQNNAPQWATVTRVSAYRDKLEQDPFRCRLSSYPEILELPIEVSYREAAVSLKR